ncbi:MAG: addiction module protein [Chitinophagaceae bacterium]
MAVDINKLLSLSQKERRKIAEKLWDSLSPFSKKEEKAIAFAEQRWQDIKSGKSKTLSSSTFWKKMDTHVRKNKK